MVKLAIWLDPLRILYAAIAHIYTSALQALRGEAVRGAWSGVKIGGGIFIVLPILIALLFLFLFAVVGVFSGMAGN